MFKIRSMKLCTFVLLIFCSLAVISAAQPGYSTPKSCPSHETYKPCGPSCQTECATLNEPCLINYIRCPDGCYCDKGYARDANGACIPREKCPPKQKAA
ncbi:PREDICTED: inducible metalloproteinase inhibitor protein-like [Bactrocera latifrons]|uniref:inducible metalloproteinase inhibitor protein-like n=1 Tax=Bactrocera latifrons TaxID=174628 RepID=UPI0008DE20A3|nr:PREDICTED: inducible metalloproteinase inhibitor protein-like [Bactrocera latifrons]